MPVTSHSKLGRVGQAEHAQGMCSPGAEVPTFMAIPPRSVRKRIKRALAILGILVLITVPFWTSMMWKMCFIGNALLLVGMVWWWMSIEWEVKSSQRVNLFQGAPEAGSERPRRSSMDLQSAFLPRRASIVDNQRRKVCILRGNAGGGHIAALEAIKDVLTKSGLNWELTEVDLPKAVETDEKNVLHKYFNVTGEEMYNWCLAHGTFISSFVARVLSTASRFFLFICHVFWPAGQDIAKNIWLKEKPDMVISVITMLNKVSCQGLRAAGMGHVPFVTIVTDMAHSFVHPWLQCPEQIVIAGTETIRRQAKRRGYPDHKVHPVSGMVMRPSFYFDEPRHTDRVKELEELKLDPNRRTCLIFYGGYAPNKLPLVAEQVLKGCSDLNLIFICGKNTELKTKLDFTDFGVPTLVLGYTRNVPKYMSLSDFCVCKPGPAVVTEAAWFGLPLLLEHNMATLAQEKVVVDWAVENRLAWLWRRSSEIAPLVKNLLTDMGHVQPHTYRRIGHTIEPNHAIFEIPDILMKVMQQHYGT